MPFDHILGVGRSPRVTEDLQINPYALINKSIGGNFTISKNLDSAASEAGTAELIINDDFDSSTNFAYSLTHTHASINTTKTSYITFDLGKAAYIEDVNSRQNISKSGTIFGSGSTMQYSLDGSTWVSFGDSLNVNNTKSVLKYSKLRFLRYKLTSNNNGGTAGTTFTWQIFFLKVIVDNLQY